MKIYKSAPLPFMGQKRRFLNDFKAALGQYTADGIYIDLFGGSGLLSHTVKRHYPNARVIYNDFDNYRERIEAIPQTNKLIADIRMIVGEYPKDKKLENDTRTAVLNRIKEEPGFVDYITLSSSLLFSMNYATGIEQLEKEAFYNVVKKTDYCADQYLNGLEITCSDYKNLFQQYKDAPNAIFLVDPPYLSTETGSYKNYWKLSDYLDVLDVLDRGKYFYFTSNKSHIVELCHWVSTRSSWTNPFANTNTSTTAVTMNYAASYTDIMLFK